MQQVNTLLDGEADRSGRLDKVLAALIDDVSRARLQELITQGQVRVNGAVMSSRSIKIKPGDHLTVMMPEATQSHIEAENIPLDIVYEDDDILVINKAAGMVVHPGAGIRTGTLVNALLAYCGPSLTGIGGVERPGLVHRLDKDTSGIMVVAKSQAGYDGLVTQFSDHSIERTYHALVLGSPMPPLGRVEKPIGRHPKHRTRMAVVSEQRGGKYAATRYKRIETFEAEGALCASLVECQLETGRAHQVRVHLASLGAPLVGDRLYLERRQSSVALLNTFSRQALHAYSLKFEHPITKYVLYFFKDIPPDMHELVSQLETVCQ
ncbi:MAG: RluA family pseudouridine synthase [Pseudomonadota bacterium]